MERKFRHYEFNQLVSGQQRRLIYTESESHMDGFCGMADAEWLTEDEFRDDRRRTLVIRIEPKRHLDPREMERECTTGWVTLHRLPFVSFAEYTDYGLTCYCQCQTGQSNATVVWAVRRALQEAGENLRTVAAPTIAKLVRTTAKILQAHVQHECPGPDILTSILPPDDGINFAICAASGSGKVHGPPLITGLVCRGSCAASVTIFVRADGTSNGKPLAACDLEAAVKRRMPRVEVVVSTSTASDMENTTPRFLGGFQCPVANANPLKRSPQSYYRWLSRPFTTFHHHSKLCQSMPSEKSQHRLSIPSTSLFLTIALPMSNRCNAL